MHIYIYIYTLEICINFKGEFNNVLYENTVFKKRIFLKNISHSL